MVRCKFTCTKVEKSLHWDRSKGMLYTASFTPVASDSEENKRFYEATPVGSLSVGQYREDVFQPGKTYYLDISEAD